MAWNYPVNFDSKQPFWACIVSPLTNKGFSFLCPCHNYSLRLENDCVFTIFVGCKFLNWILPISYLRECKGEDDTFKTFNMEPISLLPENYISLGRKKVGLTYRWLLLNEEKDLIRKKEFLCKVDLQEKRSQKAKSILSVTICHLTPVSVVARLWEACDEVFQRDLFPLCPPSVLDSIRCLLFGPVEQR